MISLERGDPEDLRSLSQDTGANPEVSSETCLSNAPKHRRELGVSIAHSQLPEDTEAEAPLCSRVRFCHILPISSFLICHMERSRIEAMKLKRRLVSKKEEVTYGLLFLCGLPHLCQSRKNKSYNF